MDLEVDVNRWYWFYPPTVAKLPGGSEQSMGKVGGGLTGMCWHAGRLYVARWSDILVLEPIGGFPPERFEIVDIITHPIFNDLHDVRDEGDHLLVVSTGAETIVSLDSTGNEIERWRLADERGPLGRDNLSYNKYSSTKPHLYHTNMAVRHSGQLYATLCNPGQIVEVGVDGQPKSVLNGLQMPHDGEFLNQGKNFVVTSSETLDLHYYDVETSSAGNESGALKFKERCRIPFPGDSYGKGWLRGVLQVDASRFLVGMSVWKFSRSLRDGLIYEVDVERQQILRKWVLPPIHDCPDTHFRGRLGEFAHRCLRPLRRRFYALPNIYKIVAWPESREERRPDGETVSPSELSEGA
jgi:hypothetical protein